MRDSSSLKGQTPAIVLTPSGTLRFEDSSVPWQQKLFELGAARVAGCPPAGVFWQAFAADCVNSLCHAALPDSASPDEADVVGQLCFCGDFRALCDSAPPIPGGEYLSDSNLGKVWAGLLAWCADQIRKHGGISPFLEHFAPGWTQVGRVFFHLGENRLDNERPFAFLATYATGLNARGQLRHTPLAQALKRYADSRRTLVRLLEPVYRAAASVAWVRALCDSGEIYQARAWTPDQAYRFLLSVKDLEKYGIGARLPDWWKKRPRLQVQTEISSKDSILGMGALLDFDIGVALGDEKLEEGEIQNLLEEKASGLVLVKNQWVEVDSEKLGQALDHWRKVKKAAKAGELSFIQGMRLLAGLGGMESDAGIEGSEQIMEWSRISAGAGLRELLQGGRAGGDLESGDIPGLCGKLRPYQGKGVAWVRFLNSLGLGACLADDMGLGKTIQILALLLLEKGRRDMAALLIAPASVMTSWTAECARFAPELRILVLHPAETRDVQDFCDLEKLRAYDLVITSYAMCARLKWLADMEWSRIIIDEAQNIKNGRTRQSMAVRRLRAPARVALTGTPIENSVADLWALFDFLNPGLLGNAREFGAILKKLQKSPAGLAPLRRITAPYILRRMKTDKNIISSLPDKTEVVLSCNLSKEQAALYRQVVRNLEKSLEALTDASTDRANRNLLVLQSLTLLKQICNHPDQAGLGGRGGYAPERSGKFLRVGEVCATIASRQERVLVFSQFREIIDPLAAYLSEIWGAPGLVLHGQTPVKKRSELVKQFQREDGPPFFILSLKAGGSGLTLTRASHVIHFDRWWNPAVEDQATDRAFRIGQKNNVLVHKCLTAGTLEEKIDAMIKSKRALAGEMLDGIESDLTTMSDEQILRLVSLDARSVLE